MSIAFSMLGPVIGVGVGGDAGDAARHLHPSNVEAMAARPNAPPGPLTAEELAAARGPLEVSDDANLPDLPDDARSLDDHGRWYVDTTFVSDMAAEAIEDE